MRPDRTDELGEFDYYRISGKYSVYVWCQRQLGLGLVPREVLVSGPPFHCLPLSPPGFLSTLCLLSSIVIHQMTIMIG